MGILLLFTQIVGFALILIGILYISLYLSLFGLGLAKKVERKQFAGFIGLMAAVIFIWGMLADLMNLTNIFGTALTFLIVYFAAYLLAKERFKLEQKKALLFGLYFFVILLGITAVFAVLLPISGLLIKH